MSCRYFSIYTQTYTQNLWIKLYWTKLNQLKKIINYQVLILILLMWNTSWLITLKKVIHRIILGINLTIVLILLRLGIINNQKMTVLDSLSNTVIEC